MYRLKKYVMTYAMILINQKHVADKGATDDWKSWFTMNAMNMLFSCAKSHVITEVGYIWRYSGMCMHYLFW